MCIDIEWLIFHDNADVTSFIPPHWPASAHSSVIHTGRNIQTFEDGYVSEKLSLKPFEDTEGASLVSWMLDSTLPLSEKDESAALKLAHKYHGLPLALRQAAAFMKRKSCYLAQFLELNARIEEELHDTPVPGYDKTLGTVWEISALHLEPLSKDLLDVLAWLDPDGIPAEIISLLPNQAPGAPLRESTSFFAALEGLLKHSFVEHEPHVGTISLHRYFQDTTLSRLLVDPARAAKFLLNVSEILKAAVPEDKFWLACRDPDSWTKTERLLSHVEAFFDRLAIREFLPTDANSAALDNLMSCLLGISR